MPAAPDIPPVKVPQHTPTIPSIDEQQKLLAAIPWEIRGYWLARGLLGVRDEEAARALLSDYRRGTDSNSDEWLIRGKGGRDRLLPVPTELARWVREHRPALTPALLQEPCCSSTRWQRPARTQPRDGGRTRGALSLTLLRSRSAVAAGESQTRRCAIASELGRLKGCRVTVQATLTQSDRSCH